MTNAVKAVEVAAGPGSARRTCAAWVLVLWTLFLLLNDLQPCCEVLGQSFPGPAHVAVLVQHHGAARCQDADRDHGHCATSDGIDTSPPSFLTSATIDNAVEFAFVGLALIVLYALFSSLSPRPVADHERGPPAPVYLTTLRLRI